MMKRKASSNRPDAALDVDAKLRGKRNAAGDAEPATKAARLKALRKPHTLPPLRDEWPRP